MMKENEDIPKQHGFKAPEGYFQKLEGRLMEGATSELPEDAGFAVPEGYFDEMEDRVMATIKADQTPVIKLDPKPGRSRWRWALSGVAAALVVVLLWNSGDTPETLWPEEAELMAYLEEGGLDVTAEELAGYMDESELDNLLEEPMVELNELEEYLINNIDDTELLIELQQ